MLCSYTCSYIFYMNHLFFTERCYFDVAYGVAITVKGYRIVLCTLYCVQVVNERDTTSKVQY